MEEVRLDEGPVLKTGSAGEMALWVRVPLLPLKGVLVEWFMAPAWKAGGVLVAPVGSNPTYSALFKCLG